MQRTLFALSGIGDSGKTTTISLVYNHFRQQGARVIYGGDHARRRLKGATEIKGAVLEIDGVLVGFASPGDRPDILLRLLEALIERGCILIVCATHTRGGTVEVVGEFGRQGFKVELIKKGCPQVDHDDGNQKKAKEIIEKVRGAIDNARLVEA
jgi:hypothetical protein